MPLSPAIQGSAKNLQGNFVQGGFGTPFPLTPPPIRTSLAIYPRVPLLPWLAGQYGAPTITTADAPNWSIITGAPNLFSYGTGAANDVLQIAAANPSMRLLHYVSSGHLKIPTVQSYPFWPSAFPWVSSDYYFSASGATVATKLAFIPPTITTGPQATVGRAPVATATTFPVPSLIIQVLPGPSSVATTTTFPLFSISTGSRVNIIQAPLATTTSWAVGDLPEAAYLHTVASTDPTYGPKTRVTVSSGTGDRAMNPRHPAWVNFKIAESQYAMAAGTVSESLLTSGPAAFAGMFYDDNAANFTVNAAAGNLFQINTSTVLSINPWDIFRGHPYVISDFFNDLAALAQLVAASIQPGAHGADQSQIGYPQTSMPPAGYPLSTAGQTLWGGLGFRGAYFAAGGTKAQSAWNANTSNTSISVSFPSAPTVGNVVMIAVGSSETITGPTTQSNWTVGPAVTVTGTVTRTLNTYYKTIQVGDFPSSPYQITVGLSGSGSQTSDLHIYELSGVTPVSINILSPNSGTGLTSLSFPNVVPELDTQEFGIAFATTDIAVTSPGWSNGWGSGADTAFLHSAILDGTTYVSPPTTAMSWTSTAAAAGLMLVLRYSPTVTQSAQYFRTYPNNAFVAETLESVNLNGAASKNTATNNIAMISDATFSEQSQIASIYKYAVGNSGTATPTIVLPQPLSTVTQIPAFAFGAQVSGTSGVYISPATLVCFTSVINAPVIGIPQSSVTAHLQIAMAEVLLGMARTGSVIFAFETGVVTDQTYYPALFSPLGEPLPNTYAVGGISSDLFSKSFSNGAVWFNSNTTTPQNITIPAGTWKDIAGNSWSPGTAALAPSTALVLIQQPVGPMISSSSSLSPSALVTNAAFPTPQIVQVLQPSALPTTTTFPAAVVPLGPAPLITTLSLPVLQVVQLMQPSVIATTTTLPTLGIPDTAAPATLATTTAFNAFGINISIGPPVLVTTTTFPAQVVPLGIGPLNTTTTFPALQIVQAVQPVAIATTWTENGIGLTTGTGQILTPSALATTTQIFEMVPVVLSPAVLATTASFPAPGVNSGILDITIATTTTFPAFGINISVGPPVLSLTASFPTDVVPLGPGPIITTASFPKPVVPLGPAPINTTTTFPVLTIVQILQPSSMATTTTIPQPSIFIGQAVFLLPAVLATTTTFPALTLHVGSVLQPAAMATTAILPAPSLNFGTSVQLSPTVFATTSSFPAPTPNIGNTVLPSVVSTTMTFPAFTITNVFNQTVFPTSFTLTSTFPVLGVVANNILSPAVIATTTSFLALTVVINNSVQFAASVLATAASGLVPTVNISETVSPGPVSLVSLTQIIAPGTAANVNLTVVPVATITVLNSAGIFQDIYPIPTMVFQDRSVMVSLDRSQN